jgi:hypothetical protein
MRLGWRTTPAPRPRFCTAWTSSCCPSAPCPALTSQSFYESVALLLAALALAESVALLRRKPRLSRRLQVQALLLLECLPFFLFNLNRAVGQLYYLMFYFQNCLLVVLFHHYRSMLQQACSAYLKYLALFLYSVLLVADSISFAVQTHKGERPLLCLEKLLLGVRLVAMLVSLAFLASTLTLARKVASREREMIAQGISQALFASIRRKRTKMWLIMGSQVASQALLTAESLYFYTRQRCSYADSRALD